jgi:hypothetical protein
MKKFLAIIAILNLSIYCLAQDAPERASIAAVRPKIDQPLPFKEGESLVYEASFSRLIFSGVIGEIRLDVTRIDSKPENSGVVELRAEAVSKGFFPKLFGIRVRDEFISEVSAGDFGLRNSIQKIDEGKNKREQRATINPETRRVVYAEQNLADKTARPKIKQADSPAWVLDVLSAIYFLRTQKLEPGSVIPVPLTENAKFYDVEVVVLSREEIKVDAGKFKTVRLDVKAFNGRYTQRKGEMHLWMTDDPQRIPVRARIKSSGATVTIDLKRLPVIAVKPPVK